MHRTSQQTILDILKCSLAARPGVPKQRRGCSVARVAKVGRVGGMGGAAKMARIVRGGQGDGSRWQAKRPGWQG